MTDITKEDAIKAVKEAADWLARDSATHYGVHEWRLFNAVEAAEFFMVKAEVAEDRLARTEGLMAMMDAVNDSASRGLKKRAEKAEAGRDRVRRIFRRNVRLRLEAEARLAEVEAAASELLARHIIYCGGDDLPFAGETDKALFERVRAVMWPADKEDKQSNV